MENRVDEFCAQHWSERVMRHSYELDVANIIRNTLIGEDRDYQ